MPSVINYNITKRISRVLQLLDIKRLDFKHKQSNTTRGLYELITKYIRSEHTVVELGSFAGVSSELFALFCGKLYCIDRWESYREIEESNKLLMAEQRFDSMCMNYTNIVKLKMDSVDAVDNFADGSIDLVYIDTDHSSEQVEREINAWYPKIKLDGWIAGHDINMPTVFNVVMDYFDPTMVEFFNDTSWITKKRNYIKNEY